FNIQERITRHYHLAEVCPDTLLGVLLSTVRFALHREEPARGGPLVFVRVAPTRQSERQRDPPVLLLRDRQSASERLGSEPGEVGVQERQRLQRDRRGVAHAARDRNRWSVEQLEKSRDLRSPLQQINRTPASPFVLLVNLDGPLRR